MVTKGHTNMSKKLEQYAAIYKGNGKYTLPQMVKLFTLCADFGVNFEDKISKKTAEPWLMESRLEDNRFMAYNPDVHFHPDADSYSMQFRFEWKSATAKDITLSNMYLDQLMNKLEKIGWITCIVGEK